MVCEFLELATLSLVALLAVERVQRLTGEDYTISTGTKRVAGQGMF